MVESLGYSYPRTSSKRKKLYGIYECPDCLAHFRAMDTNVRTGNTARCEPCAKLHRAATRTVWSLEALRSEAVKYDTRQSFKHGSPLAYSSARKQGLLDKICAEMRCGKTIWTLGALRDEASRFSGRTDFMINAGGAYKAAVAQGVLDEVCAHMEPGAGTSDNDAVYIWRVVGRYRHGKPVFKIGVTSSRLREKRISAVASLAKVKADTVALVKVPDARAVESELLLIGEPAAFNKGSGHTEYRALSSSELEQALVILARASL